MGETRLVSDKELVVDRLVQQQVQQRYSGGHSGTEMSILDVDLFLVRLIAGLFLVILGTMVLRVLVMLMDYRFYYQIMIRS